MSPCEAPGDGLGSNLDAALRPERVGVLPHVEPDPSQERKLIDVVEMVVHPDVGEFVEPLMDDMGGPPLVLPTQRLGVGDEAQSDRVTPFEPVVLAFGDPLGQAAVDGRREPDHGDIGLRQGPAHVPFEERSHEVGLLPARVHEIDLLPSDHHRLDGELLRSSHFVAAPPSITRRPVATTDRGNVRVPSLVDDQPVVEHPAPSFERGAGSTELEHGDLLVAIPDVVAEQLGPGTGLDLRAGIHLLGKLLETHPAVRRRVRCVPRRRPRTPRRVGARRPTTRRRRSARRTGAAERRSSAWQVRDARGPRCTSAS